MPGGEANDVADELATCMEVKGAFPIIEVVAKVLVGVVARVLVGVVVRVLVGVVARVLGSACIVLKLTSHALYGHSGVGCIGYSCLHEGRP